VRVWANDGKGKAENREGLSELAMKDLFCVMERRQQICIVFILQDPCSYYCTLSCSGLCPDFFLLVSITFNYISLRHFLLLYFLGSCEQFRPGLDRDAMNEQLSQHIA
jgi:hypothetical protein